MLAERDNVRFNTLRNALYHTARRRFFERANRIFNFTVILLGTAAVAAVAPPILTGLAVAVVGALQLVFDFGRAARDHQALQSRYYALLAEIERDGSEDPAACRRWWAEIITISGDEPPSLRALESKAYNDALDATEIYPPDQRLLIPSWHVLIGWIWPFDGYTYRKLCELPGSKDAGRAD